MDTCSLDDGKRHEQSAVSTRGDRGGVHLLEEREFGHCRRAEATGHIDLLRAAHNKNKSRARAPTCKKRSLGCITDAEKDRENHQPSAAHREEALTLLSGINTVLGRVPTPILLEPDMMTMKNPAAARRSEHNNTLQLSEHTPIESRSLDCDMPPTRRRVPKELNEGM